MQHLVLLTGAGLVESQKPGRVLTVQLVPGALDEPRHIEQDRLRLDR